MGSLLVQPMLRRCPICNSKAHLYAKNHGKYWYVECRRDPSCCRIGAFSNEIEAADWWNTRYEEPEKEEEKSEQQEEEKLEELKPEIEVVVISKGK